MNQPDFREMETRGFVLIPSFLSEAEVRQCREDFSERPVVSSNRNYGISTASNAANQVFEGRVKEVLSQVQRETNLRPNLPMSAAYFAVGRGIKFNWHQDHESFFSIQNHYDYLNFYVPVVKPVREKSNLSIIPFDALEAASSMTFRLVVRGGGALFVRFRGKRLVFLDDTGSVHRMDIDLDGVAHTPMLNAGDLLLMRGDMIHRTQDADTERVSASYRVGNAETPVQRSKLVRGGWVKARMMMKNASAYRHIFNAFDDAGKDTLPFLELRKHAQNVPLSTAENPREFFKFLLGQKLREGVLFHFLRATGTCLLADRMVALDDQWREYRHRHPQAA